LSIKLRENNDTLYWIIMLPSVINNLLCYTNYLFFKFCREHNLVILMLVFIEFGGIFYKYNDIIDFFSRIIL